MVRFSAVHLTKSLAMMVALSTLGGSGLGLPAIAQTQASNPGLNPGLNGFQYWQQRTVWRTVQAPDGGFSILMPNTPRYLAQGTSDRSAPEQHFMTATEPSFEALYMVGWTDATNIANGDTDTQSQMFAREREALLQGFQGQILQENRLSFQDYPGRQYKITSQLDGQAVIITHRSYLIGSRLYQMTVAVPERLEPGFVGMAEGFMQSFRVTG